MLYILAKIAKISQEAKSSLMVLASGTPLVLAPGRNLAAHLARAFSVPATAGDGSKRFVYFKYWKPAGTVSTSMTSVPLNILESGMLSASSMELFSRYNPLVPVGRLDKDSTGLLLLSNREQLSGLLLRTFPESPHLYSPEEREKVYGSKYEKIYLVETSRVVNEKALDTLRAGVTITTVGRRRGAEKRRRKTLPCKIFRADNYPDPLPGTWIDSPPSEMTLVFHLREGRNRQIRKMLGSLGHKAATIHRVSFGGITLEGLVGPGDVLPLTEDELKKIGCA